MRGGDVFPDLQFSFSTLSIDSLYVNEKENQNSNLTWELA